MNLNPGPVQTQVLVRWIINSDVPRALELCNSWITPAMTERNLRALLRVRSYIGLVAELADGSQKVVGYLIYDLDTMQILSMAVDPQYQLQGIGRQMLDNVKIKLTANRPSLWAVLTGKTMDARPFLERNRFIVTEGKNILLAEYTFSGLGLHEEPEIVDMGGHPVIDET
jgi:GNAT superfamily N-acetyltransferase